MSEPRRCASSKCRAVLIQRPKTESDSRFAERITCSNRCAANRRSETRTRIVDEKPCQQCGATMRRDPRTTSPTKWQTRTKYCSRRCVGNATKLVGPNPGPGPRPMAPNLTRSCVQCGGSFTRRVGSESTIRFAARACCSRPCAQLRKAALRSEIGPDVVLPESKPCQQCGVEFPRPRLEGPKRWTNRRYCSPTCAGAAKRVAVPKPRKTKAVPRNARTSIPVPPKPPAAPAPVWRPAVWIEHEKARAS